MTFLKYSYDTSGKNWKNIEFYARIKLIDYFSTKSTVKIRAVSTTNNDLYGIFFSDLFDMLQNGSVIINENGVFIEGTFIVVKRGDRFGIRLKDTPEYNKWVESRTDPSQPVNCPIDSLY